MNEILLAEQSGTIAGTTDLVRRIALAVGNRPPSRVVHRSDGSVEELLLEEEIDGARYTLVRSYSSTALLALSPREREIARLVAHGLPNKGIGAVLEISTWTVATHLRRIFVKLGVTSRAAMVANLMEAGQGREIH
jgi:two-component system, NarL family, nitrate/nitrite response regulator NarL